MYQTYLYWLSYAILCVIFTSTHGLPTRQKRGEGCDFVEAEGYALYGHNDRTYTDSTLVFCKKTCLKDSSCKSIDFNKNTKSCFISSDTRETVPGSYGRHNQTSYYQKNCGSLIEDWDPSSEDYVDGSGYDEGAEIVQEEGHCMRKYGPYGGRGGITFSDASDYFARGNITAMHIRYGIYIDGLGFTYGKTSEEKFHGNPNGGDKSVKVDFESDEYIISATGRKGHYLDQLTFITNKRTLGPYGGGGGKLYVIELDGKPMTYISGKSARLLDQIAYYFHC